MMVAIDKYNIVVRLHLESRKKKERLNLFTGFAIQIELLGNFLQNQKVQLKIQQEISFFNNFMSCL